MSITAYELVLPPKRRIAPDLLITLVGMYFRALTKTNEVRESGQPTEHIASYLEGTPSDPFSGAPAHHYPHGRTVETWGRAILVPHGRGEGYAPCRRWGVRVRVVDGDPAARALVRGLAEGLQLRFGGELRDAST